MVVTGPRLLGLGSRQTCILALFAASVTTCLASPPARLVIYADRTIGRVNRWLFGNNILAYQRHRLQDLYGNRGAGIWDPERRAPVPEYLELAKRAGICVARWPGGCGTHLYNWKLTVGPVEQRPEQKFGLFEFLQWCEAAGAVPLITLADYWGNARDAADLVEYLNSPVGANPNGGKDWAAVRAAQGREEPWNVFWFEYGNETYHGDHRGRRFTPEQYGRLYLEYWRAMKRVDRRVKLGLVMWRRDWNEKVLKIAGRRADFLIMHVYRPGAWRSMPDWATARVVGQACLAADLAIREEIQEVRRLAKEITGRDIPIAITEYNAGFVQEEPVPYRHSLAAALRNADFLRTVMDPALGVIMACFWQYSNEYWGMVRGYVHMGQKPVRQANYFVYELYHDHFGDRLVPARVWCERWDFGGGLGVPARRGEGAKYREFPGNLYKGQAWQIVQCPGVKQRLMDGGRLMEVEFGGKAVNYYHAFISLPAEPGMGYRVIGWVKTEGIRGGSGVGFQVGDARGWTATKSATVYCPVAGTKGWTRVVLEYVGLSDTRGINVIARHVDDGQPISGKAWFRIEGVYKFQPRVLPGVPYVEAVASVRERDGKICAVVVHKDVDAPTELLVRVHGRRIVGASAWALNGPSLDATNLSGREVVGIRPVAVEVVDGAARVDLPPHSVVALELEAPSADDAAGL